MPSKTSKSSLAAAWRRARRVYPIYSAAATQFGLGVPPYKDLHSTDPEAEPEIIRQVNEWLAEIDLKLQAQHLRLLLQSTQLGSTEEKLHTLVERYVNKQPKTPQDRDKLDFLLVQYFITCAPPSFHKREVGLGQVAEVLEPVIGETAEDSLESTSRIKEMERAAKGCAHLGDFKDIIESARGIKASYNSTDLTPEVLVALTHLTYIVRRTFFRLLRTELASIEKGLTELEAAGVTTLDCSSLNLSSGESLKNLREMCSKWQNPKLSEYSTNYPAQKLVELRTLIDETIRTGPVSAPPDRAPQGSPAKIDVPKTGDGATPSAADARVAQLEEEQEQLRATVQALLSKLEMAKQSAAGNQHPAPAKAPAPDPDHTVYDFSDQMAVAGLPESGDPEEVAGSIASTKVQTSSATDGLAALRTIQQEISDQLSGPKQKRGAGVGVVSIGKATSILSEEELRAFLRPEKDPGELLRRGVAARLYLLDSLEGLALAKDLETVKAAVGHATNELAGLNSAAQAADSSDKDRASSLRATTQKLESLLSKARAVRK